MRLASLWLAALSFALSFGTLAQAQEFPLQFNGALKSLSGGQAEKTPDAPKGPVEFKHIFGTPPPVAPCPKESADEKKQDKQVSPFRCLDGQILVFVIDGVGDSQALYDNLRELRGERNLPVRIFPVKWTSGEGAFKDNVNHNAQLAAADQLARYVLIIRDQAPNAQVIFLAHSAGTRIALAAAEMLPANSVARIILAAPSVSRNYNLTQALVASRAGIDNFYSPYDGFLEHVSELPTTDGQRGPTAGLKGFAIPYPCAKDSPYAKLRQYPYRDDMHGHGGHYHWIAPKRLDQFITPLFFGGPVSCTTVSADPSKKE